MKTQGNIFIYLLFMYFTMQKDKTQNNIIGGKKTKTQEMCHKIILQSKMHLYYNVIFPYNSQQECQDIQQQAVIWQDL